MEGEEVAHEEDWDHVDDEEEALIDRAEPVLGAVDPIFKVLWYWYRKVTQWIIILLNHATTVLLHLL